ncbi:amino acid ABC transporter ATP-binding protein [Phyllobacterium myrsinacearum]|uniref:Phosphate ABC transporter ATP-binding protein n=1 Tax=Phyllobacterium myrsinacearum TaxID=28101 RepID=A0A2S9JQD1_9HYPH|nr:amino acid ABC transporter ATP-binding protein [Phyllobacterium myrsinacearum]PRD55440.1 phosphate ABC transporter ATP-binding protein [Phyllobacterium myrsinacearum]PWV91783.1 polar amino acid transport system ATP-binding protein [Phyllobacterium myrsinacearum]RZV05852.1 polar amino acid transport system ATP-binding protein [Phyllobacterium myrsinacearum]
MSAAVKLHEVIKRFGSVDVLKGVSFDVAPGEVVALIGQSGSGKSTALRCINRLESIQGGTIEVCGHRVESPELNIRALRQDVGMVFQSYNLFPHMNVAENIMLALRRVKNIGRAEAFETAKSVLAKVGLIEKIEAYPEQLSGGQQQRVAIARSLAMQPKVMLFDEVTSALDPQLTGEVLRVMEDLAKGGMTMIVVTHEMAFARKVANRVIYMNTGRVWETGTGDMLVRPETKELKEFLANGL